MGLPVHPQDPPCLSSLSQKGMAFFLNAGLVGNLCGLAVRKQINYSYQWAWRNCCLRSWVFFWLPDPEFPRASGQAEGSVILGDSCSESRDGKWLAPGCMQSADVLCLGFRGLKQNWNNLKLGDFYIKSGFLSFLERWEGLQYMWKLQVALSSWPLEIGHDFADCFSFIWPLYSLTLREVCVYCSEQSCLALHPASATY